MLNATLLDECGKYYNPDGTVIYVGLAIYRPDRSEEYVFKGKTVGEFLLATEHQSGSWLIDGGWGGPPGPLRVRWVNGEWVNDGFQPWNK